MGRQSRTTVERRPRYRGVTGPPLDQCATHLVFDSSPQLHSTSSEARAALTPPPTLKTPALLRSVVSHERAGELQAARGLHALPSPAGSCLQHSFLPQLTITSPE